MKKYMAEMLGTFTLVFAGTGAIVANDFSGGVVTHVGIALSFGLAVLIMVYAIGDISGAHVNPAVTFGFWCTRRLPGREVPPYVISQLAGAFLASGLLRLLFPEQENLGATLPSVSVSHAFILEVVLSFLLMFVIIHVVEGAKEVGLMAGVAIGGTIAMEALFAGPFTGASMNPARSIAPAVVSGATQHLWLYVAAPLIGAGLGSLTCRLLRGDQCCLPVKK